MQRKRFKGNQLTSWLAEWSVSFSFYPVMKWHVNKILVWAGFYFCQWLETCKKKREGRSVYFSISRFVSVKQRQKWEFLNPGVVSVLRFHFFSPPAQSCWVAIATWLLPHNPVRLTGYRFSSKWGQDQNPDLGHWSQKVGGLGPRTTLCPGCAEYDGRSAMVAYVALLRDPVMHRELNCHTADGITPRMRVG